MMLRAGLLAALLIASSAQAQEAVEPSGIDEMLRPAIDEPKPEVAPEAAPEQAKPKTLLEALEAVGFDPKTKIEAGNVQVMQGQRALFHLDAQAAPVLDEIQTGKLAVAQPKGLAETYKGSGAGRIGVALDGASAKRESYLKVWNGLASPISFELELAAVRGGQLMRRRVEACSIPAGAVHNQSWPYPIVAITVFKIVVAPSDALPCS